METLFSATKLSQLQTQELTPQPPLNPDDFFARGEHGHIHRVTPRENDMIDAYEGKIMMLKLKILSISIFSAGSAFLITQALLPFVATYTVICGGCLLYNLAMERLTPTNEV